MVVFVATLPTSAVITVFFTFVLAELGDWFLLAALCAALSGDLGGCNGIHVRVVLGVDFYATKIANNIGMCKYYRIKFLSFVRYIIARSEFLLNSMPDEVL